MEESKSRSKITPSLKVSTYKCLVSRKKRQKFKFLDSELVVFKISREIVIPIHQVVNPQSVMVLVVLISIKLLPFSKSSYRKMKMPFHKSNRKESKMLRMVDRPLLWENLVWVVSVLVDLVEPLKMMALNYR